MLQWSEADHECLKKKTRMNKKSNPDSSGEHLNEECIFYRTIVFFITKISVGQINNTCRQIIN